MDVRFTPNEARVIGCLMEKAVITPDQYPLSLNALVNACNQKSSREPVLSLDPGVVQRTVNDLVEKRHVMVQNFGSRVDKYQQRFCNTQFALIQFTPAEYAVICLLLLRGPQTPGELRGHSGRLHEFSDVAEVDAALESLLTRSDGPFVARLPREPRRKDHAYAHLFGGPIESAPADAPPIREPLPAREPPGDHIDGAFESLERRVADLERVVGDLKRALGMG
ncbi:MAG TPA: DUF480 domain-containing protein [Gammaproteobacteria bacterium]|nr:DUF480 domain-containing protein [Gammaproteobacteria bacterium]